MTPERLSEIKKICACVPFIDNGIGVMETQQAFHDIINALISDAERLAAAEARVRELEEAVRELAKGWRWSKSQPDNPIARAAVSQKEVE